MAKKKKAYGMFGQFFADTLEDGSWVFQVDLGNNGSGFLNLISDFFLILFPIFLKIFNVSKKSGAGVVGSLQGRE